MAVSIIDVANKAGVSKSTVSRVLTNGAVNPVTKELILSAMDELGYVPNVAAQSLRGRRATKIIGVYLPFKDYMQGSVFDYERLTVFFRGLETELVPKGYNLLFIYDNLINVGDVPSYVDYFEQNRIDGLVTMGISNDEAYLVEMAEKYKAVVYTGKPIPDSKAFNMYLSYTEFNLDVYDYLFMKGHHQILSITDFLPEFEIYTRKQKAYEKHCQRYQLTYNPDDILVVGHAGFYKELEKRLLEGYTAIYTENYTLAGQVMNILGDRGLKIGEDISVLTVKHGEHKRDIYPNLTAIEIPYDKVGQICGKQIIQAIEGGQDHLEQVTIRPKIVESNSVVDLHE